MKKGILNKGEWPLLIPKGQAVGNCAGRGGGGAPPLCGHSRLSRQGPGGNPTACHTHKHQVRVGT